MKASALWHQLSKWKLTFKKILHASEQDPAEVQAARREWQAAQPALAGCGKTMIEGDS